MPIDPGTRLGPYEIVAPIGAGGMGEVYKGRDTRLDRSVAIKILPGEFAENASLKLRFEREAKTISQLSHPNICALYDVGENYLVMELLDGETLADRLARGPLPLAEVFKYGVQIAEALAKAHRHSVTHRDLKPGNVILTKSGAKLLDFGLAKGGSGTAPGWASTTSLATAARPLTEEGAIVGTFQYMAPEQIEGAEADARTDLFAFGAVLYEMATGKRAFEGKSRASLIASILDREPVPVSALQPMTPPALEHVIRKCLEKDPDARWQNAQDVAEELRWISESRAEARSEKRSLRLNVPLALAALVAGALLGGWFIARRRPVQPVTYSNINAPEQANFSFDTSIATLSPDGRRIVFAAKPDNGATMLFVRSLDSPAAQPLRGTEGGIFPFWSPDGRSLAFFAGGKLKRIAVAGGAPETIASAANGRGGAWGTDDMLLYSPSPASPLFRVPASGGEPKQVTRFETSRGDTSHRFPILLPDQKHFLCYIQGASEGGNVLLGAIGETTSRIVMNSDSSVVFAPPDVILFTRDGALRAQRMDLQTFRMIGEPVMVAEGVQNSSTLNFTNVSASQTGLLAYVSGKSATVSTLTYFDASGKEGGVIGQPADQLDPRIAPDGHMIVAVRNVPGGSGDIWAIDPRRNVETRLTFSTSNEFAPTWSPDSKSIAYASFERRPGDLFVKRVEESGPGVPVVADARRKIPSDWSRDGKFILYHALSATTLWDVEVYSFQDRKMIPLVHTPAAETLATFSPDGQWISYTSDESGRAEIYVQHFPLGAEKWQVSGGGGSMSLWSRDGKGIYYIGADGKMMFASVNTANGFVADAPRPLFETRIRMLIGVTRRQYDVGPDGRFLLNHTPAEPQSSGSITLVQNWSANLQ
jgi:serine/threonine protein kinase